MKIEPENILLENNEYNSLLNVKPLEKGAYIPINKTEKLLTLIGYQHTTGYKSCHSLQNKLMIIVAFRGLSSKIQYGSIATFFSTDR